MQCASINYVLDPHFAGHNGGVREGSQEGHAVRVRPGDAGLGGPRPGGQQQPPVRQWARHREQWQQQPALRQRQPAGRQALRLARRLAARRASSSFQPVALKVTG